jgi:hypothetical protein
MYIVTIQDSGVHSSHIEFIQLCLSNIGIIKMY